MALEIIWSPRAIKNFDSVITYLKKDWTEREIKNFVAQTFKTLNLISESPYLYKPLTGNKTIREAIITKHNLLIYRIEEDKIAVLALFDTRQHPSTKRIKSSENSPKV